MQFIHFIGYYYELITGTSISRSGQAIFVAVHGLKLEIGK